MGKTLKQKEALLKVNHSKRLTTDQFIEKARLLHGDKFDYSKTNYINATTKLNISCPEHGIQTMLPHHHTNSKSYGCPVCGKKAINSKKQLTTETLLEKIGTIQGLSFDKLVYKSKREDVTVTCDVHGDYVTKAEMLLKGCGCPKCKSSTGEHIISEILDKNSITYTKQKSFKDLCFKRRLKFDFYLPV